MAIRILSSENITGNLTLSGNQTTGGNLYVTGTSNSLVVISRDNMYVDVGQLYIGADDGTTDDTFRQRVASGSYFIESRKSGTWTHRLQINTAGTLIVQQGMAISGNIDGVGATFTGTAASGAALVTIENNSGSTATSYGLLVKGGGNSSSGKTFEVRDDSGNTDLIVKGNGNVGINTNSPLAKLSVVGSGENGGIFFGNSGAQEHRFYASANSQFNTIGSSTPIWNWAQYTGVGVTPNYKMTLTSTGLGIGDTSPSTKIDVYQSTVGIGVADFRHVNGNRILINPSYNYYDAYNHIFRGLNGTDTYMTIDLNGNIGIGTTSNISSPLTVQTNGSGGALSIIGRNNGTNDEAIISFYEYDGTTRNSYIIKEAGDLGFATGTGGSATERLRINSAGSIYPPIGPATGTTYYGYDAGLNVGSNSHNTYYGYYAGRANTGTRNTFIGSQVAYAGTNNLNYNVLIGHNVLRVAANTCESNVVIGDNAMTSSSGASNSVVIGQGAAVLMTGDNNTVVGYEAYRSGTTGSYNVLMGYQVGYAASQVNSVIIGFRAGYVNTANSNVYIGGEAGRNNTSGGNNVFIGPDAGYANVTGSSNTFVGTQCAVYQQGLYNTALGHLAMGGTSGTGTGQQNTAIGNNAGRFITNANQTTFVGRSAGYNNTTGQYNTGIGSDSLRTCTIGAANTAIGLNALYDLTDGNNNTTLGLNAGYGVTTGLNNLFLGANAGRSTASGGLGNITSGSNQIQLGNNTSTNFLCKIALTVTSDKRDKTNFKEIPLGLDFVSQLKPTSFEFKKERESNEADGIERYGFLAQDILELEAEKPVIINNDDKENLKYTSDHLIPVLVKAIQELKAEIELLKNK